MELASGTVTFLLTDLEGSTRLWEDQPELMRRALARHDEIAGSIIPKFDGALVKARGEGDSLFAVFTTASAAVAAASALQSAFGAEPWPVSLSIRVRMALHTGDAGLRDGDYYGPPVNRCARLRAIAHGGQILVSGSTATLCQDALPAGCTLLDLGAHRLRDLGRPDTVCQLCHAGLPAGFPPLRSLEYLPTNLPQQVSSFIGRERELAAVKDMVRSYRLVTLTGSGGCGKTRLALQAAADLLEDFPDGVWLAELAALTDPALAPHAVAAALGEKESPGKSIIEVLSAHLCDKRLLLVLDNCEHLLEAVAMLADAVLRDCPKVQILATSREGLRLGGEALYRVPSLPVPDPCARPDAESLQACDSACLFVERACLQRPEFSVTSANAAALASVCRRLDGIPLAIELAAARIGALAVEEIDGRLNQRFRLLTGGWRASVPRQQTLRSLIDWSYDLLSDSEQALFCRLSVFAGGWTLQSAEDACAAEPAERQEVVDLLSSLCNKSLVLAEPAASGMRYGMLEMVREYARERLEESGSTEAWRSRHADHFLALAAEAEPQLNGASQQHWLDRLEGEHSNLRSAFDWGMEPQGHADLALRLAGKLYRFWALRAHFSEGRQRLSRALSSDDGADPADRAKALNAAGNLAFLQGDYASARALHQHTLEIRRKLEDQAGIAACLGNLGNEAMVQADYVSAGRLYEESLSISRNLGDDWSIANTLNNLGTLATRRNDLLSARAYYEESLAAFRRLGEPWGIAALLSNLGTLAAKLNDASSARALYEESLVIRRETGDRQGTALDLCNLADVAIDDGELSSARALLDESLEVRREVGDQLGIAYSLEGFARLQAFMGNPLRAARIWGAAERLRADIGAPVTPHEREGYEQAVGHAREVVADGVAFARAWKEGRAMTADQAADYASGASEA